MSDPDLFQHAIQQRDASMTQVETNADEQWKGSALEAIKRTAEALPDFISDDVWDTGKLVSTREDRALGPIFRAASRNGWITRTDRHRPSVRSHLSGKPVWRSNLYRS